MDVKQECIVTITDGLSPTSMPLNEFVNYRLSHRKEEKQILIQVFEKGIDKNIELSENIEFYSVGKNFYKLRKIIQKISKEYHIKAFHIHEGKSVILFSAATLLSNRSKTIYTIHSTYKNYPLHNKIFCLISSLLAKKVTCVSNTSYKYYPKLLKRIRGKNIISLQNGVDMERVDSVKIDCKKKNPNFTLTYVARLVQLKRHTLLFDIIAKVPDAHLDLIGIGPLEENLKQYAGDLGIADRVHFLGLQPREEVYRRLKTTDMYVSTSSYEGLPIGVLEALACGVVSVVTNIEQHEEIRVKCSSLITLPPNVDIWKDKLLDLMNTKQSILDKIGAQGKEQVEKYFSLSSMHNNYDQLYMSL